MPRLCRSNRAAPISASSAFTRCVTLDCTVLSSSAARVIPPVRATAENVMRSVSSTGKLRFILEMAAFESIHFKRMLARPNLVVQIREEGHADQHAIDHALGRQAPDPAGADGYDCRRPAHGGREQRWRLWHSWRRLWR